MASLTDIIFLLLIFFMLTSSVVMPNALKLLLPRAKMQKQAKTTIIVNITPDRTYIINNKKIAESDLENVLRPLVQQNENPTVAVNADKRVPIDNVVKVMMAAKDLNAKVILLTKPD